MIDKNIKNLDQQNLGGLGKFLLVKVKNLFT